jgi:exodeoxyribonuclease V beta subunit
LPCGNETGIILHRIFEMISFDAVKQISSFNELIPLVSPYLKGTAFALWEDVVARMIYSTLKTPLDAHTGFCLCDVDPKRMYREMEFLYPCDEKHHMFDGMIAKAGFLKGVVDAFFEHEGKYYIVDWKSNWLGPTQDCYSEKYMEEAMTINHYDLQVAIYREAFEKYLKVFDHRPFEEIFGGVYYFFVRGVSETTGILSVENR